jgi:predicted enzyme related to lactoylglutathione lyase
MSHPVLHFQMISTDPDASTSFYSRLFGWTVKPPDPMGFRMLSTGSERGISGGIWPAPPEIIPFVQLFIGTDDVAASVDEALALGAKVEIPPIVLPSGDELAVLHDPLGMHFGLWKKAGSQKV